jgi:hypothetical protein
MSTELAAEIDRDPFGYIRRTYGVPAREGGRVRYMLPVRTTAEAMGPRAYREGTILTARNAYVLVLLDGDAFPRPFHPTWNLTYLEPADGDTPRAE